MRPCAYSVFVLLSLDINYFFMYNYRVRRFERSAENVKRRKDHTWR